MHYGWQQILGIGLEAAYEVETAPSFALGIVLGGEIWEGADVYAFYGPESKLLTGQQYGRVECGGRCNMLLGSLYLVSVLVGYGPSGLSSMTLDCGVAILGSVLPRRMVGSKVDRMRIRAAVGRPVEVEIGWMSQRVTDGAIPTYGVPFATPFWTAENIVVSHAGTDLIELQALDVEIRNGLKPKYLANRQAANPRSLAWIDESPREIRAKIAGFDRIPPAVRALLPGHAAGGFTITIALDDPCNYESGLITLSGCFQPEVREPLAPMEAVEYETEISVGSIAMS